MNGYQNLKRQLLPLIKGLPIVAVIFIGLVSLLIVFIGGIATYLFWVVAPIIIVGLIGTGVMAIIL